MKSNELFEQTIIFLNLTNGLLWNGPFDGFIRIQSCHCERKCWGKVLDNLDNNFLMWLALGKEITIVDYSARKLVPRSLYQGLEWVWFALSKSWNLEPYIPIVHEANCLKYFEQEYRNLSKDTLKRLKYFRKFLNNPQKPSIISAQTDKDGDYEYLRTQALKI